MIRILSIALALAAGASAAPIKGEVKALVVSKKFKFMGADEGGDLNLTFKLRYRLGSFFGEPVLRFSPHYSFGSFLTLIGRDGVSIQFMRSTTGDKVSYVHGPGGSPINHHVGGVISVPHRIFDKIELVRYEALLNLGWAAWRGGRTEAKIIVNNEGLLGRCGEWGWDIGGSPNWDQLFLRTSADTAKELYRKFMDEAAKGDQPRASLDLTSIDVDLSSFRHEIIKQLPRAFDPLYRGGLDRQARALIDAAVEKLRANPGGSIAADLKKRREITDRFFSQFHGRLDSSLRDEWAQLKKAIEYTPQIEKRVRELKRAVDSGKLNDKDRVAAQQLLTTGAVRQRLIPRSTSRALEAAARRMGEMPMTQSAEFYVVVVQTEQRSSPRKSRTKGLQLVNRNFFVHTVGASRVLKVPYIVPPEISTQPGPGRLELDRILGNEQWERMNTWQAGLGKQGDFELHCFGTNAEAEQFRAQKNASTIHVESPPDLTR